MSEKLPSFSERFAALLYPRTCVVCRELITTNENICENCVPFIFPTSNGCRGCGQKKCQCDLKDHIYDKCLAAYVYDGKLKDAYCRCKFRGERSRYKFYADELAKVFGEELSALDYDFVTVVPGSHSKKQNGGYNFAELIARKFAHNIHLPFMNVLKKVRKLDVQHNLSIKDRRQNVRGAYRVKGKYISDVNGKKVLLVDDIRTSGATLDECTRELKFAGASFGTAISVFAPRPINK